MAESLFIRADEVIRLLGVSKSEAYRIIKRLNDEMDSKGYIAAAWDAISLSRATPRYTRR